MPFQSFRYLCRKVNKGVPHGCVRAEIIPYEPDAVNTDERIVDSDIYFLSPPAGCSLWFTR